jgi:hypothetical protein
MAEQSKVDQSAVERFPLPVNIGELAILIEAVSGSHVSSAWLQSLNLEPKAVADLMERLNVFGEYVKAKQKAAKLGLVVSERPLETP